MGFDLDSLSEATSGAIGALVSTTVLYPLDTCKTKYQAELRAPHQQKYRDLAWVSVMFGIFPMFCGKQFLPVKCFHCTRALGQRTCSPSFHNFSTSTDTASSKALGHSILEDADK
ncbi:hypothetical protein F2P56_015646 [Juglans regia]|uniref:Peroxisomal adenine nucleotide carrier 1-like n=1 Tax=Juglans regia TaxID=51240 RepID=A0A834CVA0_JUGRE|nr:hypothetical protein F2P56_015646 [Juglans regia]